MEGNIVGEPFEEFVANQIKVRQKAQFSGKNSLRTDGNIQYLTNRNAWVKLASSVKIEATERLQKIFGTGNTQANQFPDTKFAESAILFNTLSTYTGPNTTLNQRGGISKTNTLWNDTFAYGIGGTEFGIQPPPGIISVQVDSLNRGSIRKANVVIKAHNRFQFDLIELLYLRLGFTMMLEWGWDKFLNANGDLQQVENTIIETEWFTSNGITQLEMLNKIQSMREKYQGNVDAFFGKVSNFTWSFNPDGTYDITIDLITLGDVIESIKVNIPNKYTTLKAISEFSTPEQAAEIYGNIAQSATLSALGAYLFKQAAFMKQGGFEGISSPPSGNGYITLDYFKISPSRYGNNYIPYNATFPSDDRFYYYVRLGTLLQLLQNYIIPQVTNGQSSSPQILISTDELLNLASYFPNQIPIDPRVCVFKIDDALNKYGDITGIDTSFADPNGTIQLITRGGRKLSQYITKDTKSGLIHGKLMNLYMNIEFISELLISNGDTNQEFSLFKFLQDLCNGINDALGGVNKLEPVIKNDSTVVFVDQTLSVNEPGTVGTVDLEVYGYNTVDQTSNFVKDVKFVSKITPQLASMISIGATAAGTSTSQIDGTAFSKWNDKLTDRFAQKVEEPDIPALSGTTASGGSTADEATYFLKWDRPINPIVTTSFWEDLKILFGITEPSNIRRKILDPAYPTLNNLVMGPKTFYVLASAIDNNLRLIGKFKPEDLKGIIDRNYGYYLSKAFGGVSNSVSVWSNTARTFRPITTAIVNARYFTFNDTFINEGKAAYKNYINELNNERFFSQNIPSSEVGFIPLSFDLILDGISGIKIYNKLSINSKFLPTNYPESLRFVITKVNHQISNNSWETSLSTISIPETKPYVYNPAASGNTGNAGSGEGSGTNGGASGGTGGSSGGAGSTNQQAGAVGTLEPLKTLINRLESGYADPYGIANTGYCGPRDTSGNRKLYISTTNVNSITFEQLRQFMLIPTNERTPCDKRRVFAAGKYQVIPSVLFGRNWETDINGGKYKELGFAPTDLFSPENQEKIGDYFLLNSTVHPQIGKYIKGKNFTKGDKAELEIAVQRLSQLFTSFPTIKNANKVIVGNIETGVGNKAYNTGGGVDSKDKSVTIAEVVKILIQTRINYSGDVPEYIPTYYTQP